MSQGLRRRGSFAASLTDPTVPGKQTQFYAMLGQRSIYHDGWLACTVHPPHPPLSGWGNFSHDRRELYNLTEDRAQSTDVAAQEPERLETLKSLWYYYAGRYNGCRLTTVPRSNRAGPRGRGLLPSRLLGIGLLPSIGAGRLLA